MEQLHLEGQLVFLYKLHKATALALAIGILYESGFARHIHSKQPTKIHQNDVHH